MKALARTRAHRRLAAMRLRTGKKMALHVSRGGCTGQVYSKKTKSLKAMKYVVYHTKTMPSANAHALGFTMGQLINEPPT